MTAFGRGGDAPLKALRDTEVFTRVVGASPVHAHWLAGEPISEVIPMGGQLDARRWFVADGVPVVTGFAAVGDAWACTNPSAGRGLSVGLIHAQALRRTLAEHGDDPVAFAEAWHAVTDSAVAPFYRTQVLADRARFAEMAALADGREPEPPDERVRRLVLAAGSSPDAFRALIELVQCMALPPEVFARPAIEAIVSAGTPLPPYGHAGPSRTELLELLGT